MPESLDFTGVAGFVDNVERVCRVLCRHKQGHRNGGRGGRHRMLQREPRDRRWRGLDGGGGEETKRKSDVVAEEEDEDDFSDIDTDGSRGL